MKKMKKIAAILLAVTMLAVCATAWASEAPKKLTNGEVGGYTDPDTPNVDNKAIMIEKDIVAYNPDESYIYGPYISYTYTITAGTANVSVTDATTDHSSGVSSVATTHEGIIAGLSVNGTTGTTGTISWTNADILEASAAGTANKKYLTLDFSGVVFTEPGIYRYTITETEHTDAEYTAAGVTESSGSHIRYLDVYVMRSDNFDPTHDGTTGHEYVAGDWRVYGYVCVYNDSTAIVDGDTNHAVKTNGFAPGTSDGGTTQITADEYHTYNLTLTKDLVGDSTMIAHQFPFAVAFDTTNGGGTNNPINGTFQLIAETDGTYSSLTTATVAAGTATVNNTETTAAIEKVGGAVALASFANAGNPKIADGNATTGTTAGKIKYIGIPNGVIASVTETNDNAGTTYTASVKEDDTTDAGTTLASVTITSTTGTMGTSNNSASIDDGETATRTAAVSNNNVAIEFTNTLALISPTGLVLRFAPYALILLGGVALLIIAMKRKGHKEEE